MYELNRKRIEEVKKTMISKFSQSPIKENEIGILEYLIENDTYFSSGIRDRGEVIQQIINNIKNDFPALHQIFIPFFDYQEEEEEIENLKKERDVFNKKIKDMEKELERKERYIDELINRLNDTEKKLQEERFDYEREISLLYIEKNALKEELKKYL